MSPRLLALAEAFRDVTEGKGERLGLVYPWWVPVLSCTVVASGSVGAVVQRDALLPPEPVALAALLVVAVYAADFVRREVNPWWVQFPVVAVAMAWVLSSPVTNGRMADLAPGVLAFSVAEMAVISGRVGGLVSAAVSVVLVLAIRTPAADVGPFYVGEILFGMVIGFMLRWQMRALAAEQRARDEESSRATLAERQRVAREVHDLVAHSLSVTLLHVTGARRSLSEDADVAEAIDALTDAERIGRQAMADIRRTVSVLNDDEPGDLRPLPGVADLDDLLADVRTAGLEVAWDVDGDPAVLGPAAGLGLFRVVQESLANVAKHAPGASAAVRLEVRTTQVHLSVTNPVRTPLPVPGPHGSGVAGMTSRAEQLGGTLRAGLAGDTWRLDLTLPVDRPEAPAAVVRRALA